LGGGIYSPTIAKAITDGWRVEPQANFKLWLAVTGSNILDFVGVRDQQRNILPAKSELSREQNLRNCGLLRSRLTERVKVTGGVRVSRTKVKLHRDSDCPFGVGRRPPDGDDQRCIE